MYILLILIQCQFCAVSMARESWFSSPGYLQRAQAPTLHFYLSEAEIDLPGPVPLYRDFMRHYNASMTAVDTSSEVETAKTVDQDPVERMPEPQLLSPPKSNQVRVFHSGGATLRGPYAFPRPPHSDRLFNEIYLHFPVAANQEDGMPLKAELNQSAVFEPPSTLTPSSSSSYLQVP